MIAIEKNSLLLIASKRRGAGNATEGYMGKHWGQPSSRGKRRNCGPFFLWFWWEGTDEAWQAGIRLANLSNF